MNADSVVTMLFEEVPRQIANQLWAGLLILLREHWLILGGLLLLIFIYVVTKAIFGRWGALGSFLYNFIYLSVLFITGLIWGPEVFVSNWFGFFTAIVLYPAIYVFVGWILNKTNLR